MCTDVTDGISVWPGADMTPRGLSCTNRTGATQLR
jgi:hypothetical protein